LVVGLYTFRLHIPHARSLKDKRAVVRGLLARVRARFNASVAEVGRQDAPQEALLAVAVVGESREPVGAVLQAVQRYVEESCPAEVVEADVEFL